MMRKGPRFLAKAWTRLQAKADILLPLALLLGALLLHTIDPQQIGYLRNDTFDNYQRLKPNRYNPDLPVRIAAIDEQSLKKFGQWPWPRTTMAMLINRLHDLGASVVGLDILFVEPDRSSPEQIVEQLPETPDLDHVRETLSKLPDNDSVLASALRSTPTVLAFALTQADPRRQQLAPKPIGGFAVVGANYDDMSFLPSFAYDIVPLPQLTAAYNSIPTARGVGATNALPGPDGIYREIPLAFSYRSMPTVTDYDLATEYLVPSFVAEILRVAFGETTYVLSNGGAVTIQTLGSFLHQSGVGRIRIGKSLTIPTTKNGSVLLYDTGHIDQRAFSLADIMKPDFNRSLVEGRIILVGATVEGLNDLKSSPITPNMPGVEFHAQAIEQVLATNLLNERPLIRPYWANVVEAFFLLAVGMIMIFMIRHRGALAGLLLSLITIVVAIAGSWHLFSTWRFLVDPIYPSATIFLIFITGTMMNFLRTEGERRQIRSDFSQYLSPVMVDRLIENPDRSALGGEIRDLTIMFSDIRGFTKISESLDPQALTQLMNRYLTPMTDIVQDHHGTIDKYIGDCIMAFWNAPLDVPEHARQALLTAFSMRAALAKLNAEFRAEAAQSGTALPEIRAGIGLNSGPGCVGNMGSEQRKTYTVLGDTVNTASRLEALSAAYGVDLVIGHETAAAVSDFALLELDQVRVKGKVLPVRIFTALGDTRAAESDTFRELRARHIALLGAYRQREWDLATAALAACREVAPSGITGLYDLYERRIAEFRLHPPPADWDGVYVAMSKAG
ncbi:MAG TPA: adenylate/guanylate cyclase domain-containing protein [Terriglobales bacterium]|nr:adenylate/guanylate cyclase domain-containing protein [Terriglobales bacterium]